MNLLSSLTLGTPSGASKKSLFLFSHSFCLLEFAVSFHCCNPQTKTFLRLQKFKEVFEHIFSYHTVSSFHFTYCSCNDFLKIIANILQNYCIFVYHKLKVLFQALYFSGCTGLQFSSSPPHEGIHASCQAHDCRSHKCEDLLQVTFVVLL